MALEGLAELFFGEDVAGAPESNYAAVEEDGVIEVCSNAGEVVGGDEESLPLRPQLFEEAQEVVLGGGVEAGEGLVEEEQIGRASCRERVWIPV